MYSGMLFLSGLVMLLDIQNSEIPPVSNKMCGPRMRARGKTTHACKDSIAF